MENYEIKVTRSAAKIFIMNTIKDEKVKKELEEQWKQEEKRYYGKLNFEFYGK